MDEKKILIIIAPSNFRDEEYFEPKRIFEENGFEVITASKDVKVAISKFDKNVNVDIDVKDVKFNDYNSIVFIGGGGALVYERDTYIQELVNSFYNKGKLVCAICIAPRILGASGILKGKKVTMWNGDEKQKEIIENYGAEFNENVNVEEDGNIITANGPISAKEFSEKIVNRLKE